MITDINTFRIYEMVGTDLGEFLKKMTEIQDKYEEMGMELILKPDIHQSVTIHKIVVPKNKRESGLGTAFLKELCSLADEYNVILALSPSDSYGGNVNRLRKFYKRFGFVNNFGRDNVGKNPDYRFWYAMIRRPQHLSK